MFRRDTEVRPALVVGVGISADDTFLGGDRRHSRATAAPLLHGVPEFEALFPTPEKK